MRTSGDRPQPPRTVLLIEDEPSNVAVMEAMLRFQPGLEVRSAHTGGSGIELARQLQPHAIVLDLNLPDLPGREVLQQLRSGPPTDRIPVIISSAEQSSERRLREEGAFAYVSKPLDLQRFVAVVEDAVARAAAARE
jgi:CheY-like chemotaxis protein